MQRSIRKITAICLTVSITFGAACARDGAKSESTSGDTAKAQPTASVIDSALPREVELERFRVGLDTATALSNGLPSRDALVNAVMKHLEARDTTHLAELALTKSEFAWLYYPTSPLGKPPYDLSPGLMYFQFDGNSRKGLFHLLEERGGKNLKVVGYNCATTEKQDKNTIYAQCMIKRLQAPGDTLSELLFGGIIERGGKFKILNFANKF